MKIKALMKKRVKGKVVGSMTNSTYKKRCDTTLKVKITQIKKMYSDSLNEAGNVYVR